MKDERATSSTGTTISLTLICVQMYINFCKTAVIHVDCSSFKSDSSCSVPFFNYELKFLQTRFSAILLPYFM